MFSQSYLKQCFDYDPETGVCTWKNRPRSHFKSDRWHNIWNKRFSGKVAGFHNARGYYSIRLDNKKNYKHRLICMWMGIDIDGMEVDHINGDRSDNRWPNIRVVSKSENLRNQRVRRNNKTGILGVSYFANLTKPWRVTFNKECRKTSTYFVETLFEAACIRKSLENKFGYHKNHGVKPALSEYANKKF
ncbi:hypothetical protein CL622_03525 [archaeon]|nr:hypothetical protein [archaeon]